MANNPSHTVRCLLPIPPDQVWELITDPQLLHAFAPPGACTGIDGPLVVGTSLSWHSFGTGEDYKRYIVECDPPTRFAIGGSDGEWNHRFQLQKRDGGTYITYSRRFRKLPLWERILTEIFTGRKQLKALTQEPMDKLQEASVRISKGDPDGLTRS